MNITVMDVARGLLRSKTDPGLIAAYLALEVELDPTLIMTPIQALGYMLRKAIEPLSRVVWYPPFQPTKSNVTKGA